MKKEGNFRSIHFKSKKFVFGLIGIISVLLVFTSSLFALVKKPEIGSYVVTLANIVVTFLGTITAVLVSAQGMVDWKNGYTNTNPSVKIEEKDNK